MLCYNYLNASGTQSINWGGVLTSGINVLGGAATQYFSTQNTNDALKAIEGGRNSTAERIAQSNALAQIEIEKNHALAQIEIEKVRSGYGSGLSNKTLIIGGAITLVTVLIVTVVLVNR